MFGKTTQSLEKTDFLKLIAAVAMLVDHCAMLPVITDPGLYLVMRSIGRISFPIFAFSIALGVVYTKDLKKYVKRLLFVAVLSQAPFSLYFQDCRTLNILVTFLIAVAMIWFFEQKWIYAAILVPLVPWCTDVLFHVTTDYSTYGVLAVFCFYFFRDDWKKAAVFFIILTMVQCVFGGSYIQMIAVLALPLIYYGSRVRLLLKRYFFYVFYPMHLLVLYVIASWMGRF